MRMKNDANHPDLRNSHFGRVTLAGCLRNNTGVSFSSMRVLGSFALVYLLEGGGHYQLRGHPPRRCQAGDLLVIFPEIAHGYGPAPGGSWSEIYVIFEGAIFDLWHRHGILTPEHPILSLLPVSRYEKQLREIVAMGQGNDPTRQLDQVCRVQSLLALAVANHKTEDDRTGYGIWPAWITAAVAQMETNLSAPIETIARDVGLSYESFRKKFRAITGVSPAHYRNRIVVDLARKLIYEQRLSNKELANQLGYCDEFHFSRRFRQVTGQSPMEFRKCLLKNEAPQP